MMMKMILMRMDVKSLRFRLEPNKRLVIERRDFRIGD